MALIFPFDESLKGYVEQVTVDMAALDYPIFTFPKGSFFVGELYAWVEGSRKLLRPGVDYKVLSLNETIPFSSDAILEQKLKENYVRNAILWRGERNVKVVWMVPYCGGEEGNKPTEYSNYLNNLYNQALTLGTLNDFLSPYQGWGGFVSANGTQIVSGQNIYNKYFDYYEDINTKGGLGWGKVQLAMMAIADVISVGGDPMEIQAFHDWVTKSVERYNQYRVEFLAQINTRIQDLKNKRVGIDQFVFSDLPYSLSGFNFVRHNSILLRGVDQDETGQNLNNPIYTKRNSIGYHGMAAWGTDFGVKNTRIAQRVSNATPRLATRVLSIAPEGQTVDLFSVTYDAINRAYANSSSYRLVVVSKEHGVLFNTDITDFVKRGTTIQTRTFTYPNLTSEQPEDILVAMILDADMNGDFNQVARTRYLNPRRSFGYKISVDSRGLVYSGETIAAVNPGVSSATQAATSTLEVTITRPMGDRTETNYLMLRRSQDTITQYTKRLDWAAGEYTKVIALNQAIVNQVDNALVYVLLGRTINPTQDIIVSTMIGYRGLDAKNEATITLLNEIGSEEAVNEVVDTSRLYLDVKFLKNVDFHRVIPKLSVTKPTNQSGEVRLGAMQYIGEGHVVYPIYFVDFVPSTSNPYIPVGIALSSEIGLLTTNQLNVVVTHTKTTTNNVSFSLSNTTTVEKEEGFLVGFELSSGNASAFTNGMAFNLTLGRTEVKLVEPPVYLNGKINFSVLVPRELIGTSVNYQVNALQSNGQTAVLAAFNYQLSGSAVVSLKMIGRDGKQIQTLATNQFFRLALVFTGVSVPTWARVTVDNTVNPKSTDVVWGGDTVNNIFLKSEVNNPTSQRQVQVSVDGWLSIDQINDATGGGATTKGRGIIPLSIEYRIGSGAIQTLKQSLSVDNRTIDLNIFTYNGEVVGDTVYRDQLYIMTMTSDLVDLSNVTTGTTELGAVLTLTVDQKSNTVTMVVRVTTTVESTKAITGAVSGGVNVWAQYPRTLQVRI